MKAFFMLGIVVCWSITAYCQTERRQDSSHSYRITLLGADSSFVSKSISLYSDNKNGHSTVVRQSYEAVEVNKAIQGKTRLIQEAQYEYDAEGREIKRLVESFDQNSEVIRKRLFIDNWFKDHKESFTYDFDGGDSSLTYKSMYYYFDGKSSKHETYIPENGNLKLVSWRVDFGPFETRDSSHAYSCEGAQACSLVSRAVLEMSNDTMSIWRTYIESGRYYTSITRNYDDTLETNTYGSSIGPQDSFVWTSISHRRKLGARTVTISGSNPSINITTGYPNDLEVSNASQRTFIFANEKEGRSYYKTYTKVRGKWQHQLSNVTYSSEVKSSANHDDFISATTRIYPSPVSDVLNIETPSKIHSLKVLDLKGQLLIDCQNCSNQVDVSSLNNGLYVVVVSSAQGVMAQRIVKTH